MGKAEKADKAKNKKKLDKWGITWIVLWSITLLCLIFLLPFGIFLLIVFLIAFPISRSSKKEKERKIKWGIPIDTPKISYYTGYGAPLWNKLYYLCKEPDKPLIFWEALPNEKKGLPKKIEIPKSNILSFGQVGNIKTYQTTKGGGVSVGGAIVGDILMGPAGAILGGRKKVKTETHTEDNRKTVLTFWEKGKLKTIFLDYSIYGKLLWFCSEKKDAPIPSEPMKPIETSKQSETENPKQDDISAQIKKLADLHTQGILTDEEFSSKKAELLARI